MQQLQRFETIPAWFRWALDHPGESRHFEHEGTRLHYLAWDTGDAHGPPVILVHGHRGHARWWDFTAPFLAEGRHVYALDLSGMGDSGPRQGYDNWTHPKEILAWIRHLGGGPVSAVGHSFGGGRLFRACSLDASAFDKLIIVDSKMYFQDDLPTSQPPAPGNRRLYPDLATAKGRFRLAPPQDWSEPYLFDYIAETSLKQTAEGWTWKFDPDLYVENHVGPLGEELLPGVTAPTNIVYGDLSDVVSPENARRVYEALPNPGKLVCIPGGYHHLMLSHPAALIATLQALL